MLLQPPEAIAHRRRRKADAMRQLGIGHAAVGLQFGEDTAVKRVEFRHVSALRLASRDNLRRRGGTAQAGDA